MRLAVVILIILSLAGLAAVASFHAKPAGAEVVCKPMQPNDIPGTKRIVRA